MKCLSVIKQIVKNASKETLAFDKQMIKIVFIKYQKIDVFIIQLLSQNKIRHNIIFYIFC